MKNMLIPVPVKHPFGNLPHAVAALAILASALTSPAADIRRADTADTLDLPAAWINGIVPTSADIAVWDNAVQVNASSTLDATGLGTNWAGLKIADPGTNITIEVGLGSPLVLGASGIDMTMLTNRNLTVACPISLAATQSWNVAAGRSLISSGGIGDSDALGKVLIKDGAGTLTIITAGTTFVGGIQVNAGTLDPNSGLVSSVGLITLNGGTWSVNGTGNPNSIQANDGTTSTIIGENNSGTFGTWTGGGTVLINNNASGRVMSVNGDMSAFNGTIRFAPGTGLGTVRANNALNVGGTNVTFDLGNNGSGTLNKNTGAGTFYIGALFGGANTVVTSGQMEDFDIGYKSDSVFSGRITGGNVGVIKSGPTTLVLAGANTYGRSTTISNGVLQIGNGGTAGQVGAGIVTNHTTLAFNRSDTFAFTNIIEGSGSVSNFGTGVLILSANNTHTGKTIVGRGTLVLPTQAGLGALPGVFTADNLILNGGALGATNNFSLSDGTRGITLGANGGGLAPNAGTTLTIPNSIAGSGSLIVSNSGTVVLSVANAYTGKTILNSGILAIADETAIGGNPGSPTADQLTLNGGTLRSTTTFTIDDANRGVTIGAAGGTFSPDASTTLTLSRPIVGTGTLSKSGAGTLIINGPDSHSGGTVVLEGTLALGPSASSSSPLFTVPAGSTFDVTALAGGLVLGSGQTLTGNGTVLGNVTVNPGGTVSPGGSIGALGITGNLTMSGGTMLVEINSATNDVINVTGNLIRTGTSTIQLDLLSGLTSGRRVLIRYSGSLSGAGTFALLGAPGGTTIDTSVANEVAIVFNINSANLTWKGDGSLNIWDTSALNWSNGVSVVAFSTLDNAIFNDSGSQTPPVNITGVVLPNSVTVNAAGNYTLGGAGKISGVGSLTKNNTGTLTILTANDYIGTTLLSQGLVQVGNGSTGGSLGTGTTTNNTTLVFNLPGSGTQSGDVAGTGSLTLQAGTLTLAGNGSYTGTTTNASGATLRVGAGAGSGSLGSGAVQNDGSLIFNRTGTLTNSGAISGTGSLTKQGSGTVALAANNTYSGATTVSAGTLQIGAGGTSGTLGAAPTVAVAGTLAFSRSDSITNTVPVTGTGSLEQKGPGVLTILTTNTYSGGTTISGGSLQLGDGVSGASLGSGSVIDNGSLIVNRSDDFFLTNTISGSGTLVKIGTNTLRFNNGTANANTYSGGTIISNGLIRLGPDAEGDPGQANGNSLGSGPVTFYGGALRLYNHTSQLNVGTAFTTPVAVPDGQSGTVFAAQNGGAFLPSSVTGSGTLTILLNSTAVPRNSIGGNWSAFTGQIIAAGDIGFRISGTDFGNAGIMISNITTVGSLAGNNAVIAIGELTGPGTLGPVDQGNINPTWLIGGKNTAATYVGIIADQGVTSVTKVGTNVWTLTGAHSYTGTTTVSNGVLALSTNEFGTDSSLASPNLVVVSPGILDVTKLTGGALQLSQTLAGDGTVRGGVQVFGTLSAGVTSSNLGNLTITSNVVVDGSVTLKIDRAGAPASDKITAPVITINGGATLNVTQIGTNDLVTGDTFTLFSVPATGAGFAVTNLPLQNADFTITYVWTNKLHIDGTIQLLSGASSSVNTNPTNITATVNGNTLELSWPADHIGWRLQVQTNPLSVGISNNWFDVAGSTAVNSVTNTFNPANGSVFYRMVYP